MTASVNPLTRTQSVPQVPSNITLKNSYLPKELMEDFLTKFDRAARSFHGLSLNEDKVQRTLKELGDRNHQNYERQTYSGFVHRKEVNQGGQLFARGDLHGDLATLVCTLEALLKDGFLDENYLPKEGNFLIVLGDMVDRGDHSLEVLALLSSLQKEAPDRVVLLRGDHESVDMNDKILRERRGNGTWDEKFYRFLQTQQQRETLTKYYESLPDALYLTTKGNKPNYLLFTHGLPPYHFEPLLHFGAPETQLVPRKIEITAEMEREQKAHLLLFPFIRSSKVRMFANRKIVPCFFGGGFLQPVYLWLKEVQVNAPCFRKSSPKFWIITEKQLAQ